MKKTNYFKKLSAAVMSVALIATSLVSGLALPVSAEEFTEGYYTYEVYEDTYDFYEDIDYYVYITDVDPAISGDVDVPSFLGGYSVIRIADEAFSDCENITSINIPNNIKSIGKAAFADCINLSTITIPDSVTSIGIYAFYNTAYECNESNWENGVLYIGNHLVQAKWDIAASYTIKEGTKTIASYAFYGIGCLRSINIPSSVTNIGSYAFKDCYNLNSITFSGSIENLDIGWLAFVDCENISSVYITDLSAWCNTNTFTFSAYTNPLMYGADLYLNGELVTDLVIPEDVTSISWGAFEGCSSIESVTIHDGVTSISSKAFYNCDNLTRVYITDLTSWCNMELSSNPLKSGASLYLNGKLITNLVIPDNITNIASARFYGCTSLTSVTIPDSVTSIGNEAFYGCTSLTSVTIPDSVTSIGSEAFYDCTSLTGITIPNSINIGEHAFSNTGYYNDISNWESGIFYIGTHLIEAKKDITGNCYIREGTKIIPYNAFKNCTSLTTISIPDSVTLIDEYAFYGCTSLTTITIPGNVTTIGDLAFAYCENLTSVTINNGVTSIGDAAFGCCTELTSIYIPDSITSIGNQAFAYCENLTSVTIPDSVTSIGNEAFATCISLSSITIPESVKEIGELAFGYYDKNYFEETPYNIEPAQSANSYGYIAGHNIAYDWYFPDFVKIPNFTITGYAGTVAEKYANYNEISFIALPYEDIIDFDELTAIVTNVTAGISASNFDTPIKDKDGNTLASDALIGTGCTITKDGTEYTIIVSGDSSGDGKVNSTDFMQVRRQYLGLFSMNTAQSLAADVTGDDNINSTDFTRIRRHFLGLYDLYA